MANHSSASTRQQTSHANRTTRTNTIVNALKQRARSVLNDKSIDAETREIIRHALETNDPCLAKLVSRADADEIDEHDSSKAKIEALAEIICRAGDESAAALFVLMGRIENSSHPNVLAHTAKHLVFTRCGELNTYGIVDAQISVLERELLGGTSIS